MTSAPIPSTKRIRFLMRFMVVSLQPQAVPIHIPNTLLIAGLNDCFPALTGVQVGCSDRSCPRYQVGCTGLHGGSVVGWRRWLRCSCVSHEFSGLAPLSRQVRQPVEIAELSRSLWGLTCILDGLGEYWLRFQ